MKSKTAVYVASQNLEFYDGDMIKEGTKSIAVIKGKAVFKTTRGIELSFPIGDLNEHYFKPWSVQ